MCFDACYRNTHSSMHKYAGSMWTDAPLFCLWAVQHKGGPNVPELQTEMREHTNPTCASCCNPLTEDFFLLNPVSQLLYSVQDWSIHTAGVA